MVFRKIGRLKFNASSSEASEKTEKNPRKVVGRGNEGATIIAIGLPNPMAIPSSKSVLALSFSLLIMPNTKSA